MKLVKTAFIIILILAILARIWIITDVKGIYRVDENEYLSLADKIAFNNHGLQSPIRSQVYPFLMASFMRWGNLFGAATPDSLLLWAKIPNFIFSILLLFTIYHFTKEYSNETAALYATLFAATSWYLIYWTGRAMPDLASAFLVLTSAYMTHSSKKAKWQMFWAGALMGLACIFKFHLLLWAVIVLAMLLFVKNHKYVKQYAVGLAVILLLQGFLDYLTRGEFFSSLIHFINVNLVHVVPWQEHPIYWYLVKLPMLVSIIPLIGLFGLKKENKLGFMAFTPILFFIILSIPSNKLERYLIVCIPFFFIILALGLERLTKKIRRPAFVTIAILLLAFNAYAIYDEPRHVHHNENKALEFVGKQADATGVFSFYPWYSSGNYFYLRREIPLYYDSLPKERTGHNLTGQLNYFIVPESKKDKVKAEVIKEFRSEAGGEKEFETPEETILVMK